MFKNFLKYLSKFINNRDVEEYTSYLIVEYKMKEKDARYLAITYRNNPNEILTRL